LDEPIGETGKEPDMKHLTPHSRPVRVARADDDAGALFIQIWATMFVWILMMGLSGGK